MGSAAFVWLGSIRAVFIFLDQASRQMRAKISSLLFPTNTRLSRSTSPITRSSERRISIDWPSEALGSPPPIRLVRFACRRERASRPDATCTRSDTGTTRWVMTAAFRAGELDAGRERAGESIGKLHYRDREDPTGSIASIDPCI